MTAIDRWERRLGVRQNLRGVHVRWDADPARADVGLSGDQAELREMSVSGAAIVAPSGPGWDEGATVVVAHGAASGHVTIRRVDRIGLDELRVYAVEFTDPDPALANALYPYLDSPATGELLATWHGRYVD